MQNLVELLDHHDPARAALVRRRLSGPEPDGVLVLGSSVSSVGRLAMTLAAVPGQRLWCAPVDVPVRESWLVHTRAVVWVFHCAEPTTEQHWALLRRLAGAVDEVHLALAGTEQGGGWPAGWAAQLRRLGETVPRLAGHRVHLLAGGSAGLASALRSPPVPPAAAGGERRNALRVLHTGLAELLERRQVRVEHAGQHELATEDAFRRRREQLGSLRREITVGWPTRVRAELTSVRLAASAEATVALRRLRDDAVEQLNRLDRAGRTAFPQRFAAAAARLAEQLTARLDGSLLGLERQVCAELGVPPAPGSAERAQPPARLVAPRPPVGTRAQERVMLLVGASGGVGLGRLVLVSWSALPAWSGAVTLPLAVGIGVGLAWWAVRVNRASGDRARLNRWLVDALTDLRGGLAAAQSERVTAAQRRLTGLVDRVAAERAGELDVELREQEVSAHRLAARRARRGDEECAVLARLRLAHTELDRLLGGPPTAPPTAPPTDPPIDEVAG